MQTKISKSLNDAFKYVVLFLLFFVWVNFYFSNFLGSVLIAVLATALCCFILTYFSHKKLEKTQLDKQDKKNCKDAFTQLMFYEFSDTLQFFSQLFRTKNVPIKQTGYGLLLYPATPQSVLFIPLIGAEEIRESALISAYKQISLLGVDKCILCGIAFSQNAQKLARSFSGVSMTLLNDEQTYQALLKPAHQFPEKKVEFLPPSKRNFHDFLELLLAPQNTKHYFYAGFITLFISLFIPFKTYYLMFSTVLLLLSLASFYSFRWFSPKNKTVPPFQ